MNHDNPLAQMPEQPPVGLPNEARKAPMPKQWAELGIEEKVERLRDEFMALRNVLQHVSETAYEARRVVFDHEHSSVGRVLVDARSGSLGNSAGQAGRFDPLR